MKFPIPQDWDGESWCRWSVCWPDSEHWAGFLRGLLTLPQRGWTWDERTGSILDVQQIGREITAQNLPLNGVIMACNDENIANSFLDIAAAIRLLASRPAGGRCCDTPEVVIQNSIQNFVVQPVGGNSIPVYGSEPPIELGAGEFPPQYASEAEYLLEKCQVANLIVDKFIRILRDLGSITNFDFYALGGTVIAIVAFNLAFPPALIPTLIGAMIALAAAAYYLPQLADYVEDNRSDWICALYESDSTEIAIAAIADLIDLGIAFISATGPLGQAVKLVAMVIMNGDNLNKLFTGFAAYGYPDADCSACPWWECAIGVIITSDATSITLEGVATEGFDALTAVSYANSETMGHLTAEITDWTPPSDLPEFTSAWDSRSELCGAGNGSDWENISGSPEPGPVLARTFQHRANDTFTVKYTRSS